MCDFRMINSVSASNTGSYSLRDFLDKFTLPQLVKVQDGYYDELQCTTIGADTVYNLLTIESVETVLFEDAEGEESRIPLGYPCTVERVAEERFQQKLRLQDLGHDSSAIKFVRVIETDPNYETVIKNGDKLKIKKKKSRENFVAFKKVSDKGKPLLKVPASCQAKFQALWDGEELPLAKFVKKNKLPVYVRFIDTITNEDTAEKEEIRGPSKRDSYPVLPEGVVKLKGILADSFVTATTEVQGVTSKFSFPKTLPISVVPLTMKAIPKSPDVSLKFISTKNEAGNDIKEFLDDENQYEDMSGFKPLPSSSQPKRGVTFKGDSEISGKCMTIAQLGHDGLGARHNTYSPVPPKRVLRSKSVTLPGKGTVLLQRTNSELQLQANVMDSKEHVYDDLNFSARPEAKHNPLLMERRRSDSSTHQVSKQNLNKLMHVMDQTSEDSESCQHQGEVVSLKISKMSPTLMSCTKMKTFGRKEKVAETESAPGGADNFIVQSCASQSLNRNPLPQTTTSSAKKNLFYGSEETESETTVALNQNILLVPKVTRSSGDALPSVPFKQGSCSGGSQLSSGDRPVGTKPEANGRHSVNGMRVLPTSTNKTESLPEPPQRSDKDANSKTQQQGTLVADTSASKTVKKDPPPRPSRIKHTGEVIRPEIPHKATNVLGDKVASFKGRQPVPSPRVKPRSFSKTSQDESHLSPTNEQKLQVTPGIGHDTTSRPKTGQEPTTSEEFQSTVKDVSKTSFIIPQDLTTLRVTEVLECLKSLNMQQFEKIFNERQVDGSMLVCLDEEALESFGMDRFHRLKLLKVIAGWRPQL
ncbi:hypothetical protein ACROYT_G011933 [Oculina patagonica]